MPGAPRPPFHADGGPLPGTDLVLTRATAEEAAVLGAATAAMEPWTQYGVSAAALASLFAPAADGGVRLVLRNTNDEIVAAAIVRPAWFAGPYVQFLVVMPPFQGQRIGTALLGWIEREARRASARNLWICTSSFNSAAARLYRRHGFEDIAILDDLVRDDIGEILMRKKLFASPSDS